MPEPGEFTGFPSPGTLVVTHDEYYAIIVEACLNRWYALQSNGLVVRLRRNQFVILPMHANHGLAGQPASFVELVTAYQEHQPKRPGRT